jgi:hypothetical protein
VKELLRPLVIAGEMAAIGSITGVNARFDRKEMVIFPDRLVLVSSGEMAGRMVAQQFGLIGMLIYGMGKKRRQAARAQRLQQTPEELKALDPKATEILMRDIIDARLSSGLFSASLKLSLAGGSEKKFSWSKRDNKLPEVRGFLQTVLGTRLIDGQKAA